MRVGGCENAPGMKGGARAFILERMMAASFFGDVVTGMGMGVVGCREDVCV
jgi:hypothetical protein